MITIFIAPTAFAQATPEACTPERKADDPKCTDTDYKPNRICTLPKLARTKVDLDTMRACANNMQNCACGLIGSASCTSIAKTGELVLGATDDEGYPPAIPRQKRVALDPKTGEVTILLDKSTAADIKTAATYTNDEQLDRMRLEQNPDLYRLTSSVVLLESSRRIAEYYRRIQLQSKPGGVKDRDDVMSKDAQELLLSELWGQIIAGIEDCDQLHMRPVPGDMNGFDFVTGLIRERLICTFRQGSSLANRTVMGNWPGCACDDNKGRMVGSACVTSKTGDRFAGQPIDERVPASLARFVKLLEASSGMKVKDVGLIGCGFERFETGPNVKNLPYMSPEDRMLRSGHISDHARGTACDLASVAFQVGCKDWSFNMYVERKPKPKLQPFYDALVDYLERTGKISSEDELTKGKKIVREGVGRFYRKAAEELSKKHGRMPGDKGFSAGDERALQLKMGILIRNALTDAGFIVFDPTLNGVHHDHFHFETPARDEVYSSLIEGDKDRENDVEPYLLRAAGVTK
ncbi:MAG: hypothetical protein HY074_19445 [Deltaproteobacteria bacterium]|nr:hypothetical protein [Deltaproteobacteria bacterium]